MAIQLPWGDVPVALDRFRTPPREYGILPFWFLNGELDPDEMRLQLRELRDKGMPGIILHGRFGLEQRYLGDTYLDRIKLAVEECERLGLDAWIYDEMNWPSGTADHRVVQERPDLTQRYLECVNFEVRGPWFTYLTGADSRYLDFERSRPVAAFALRHEDHTVVDLTPNLSFENVIPWEAPEGRWQLIYVVEKRADYYIDALDPESTKEFLRLGYEPYAATLDGSLQKVKGFYTDEPAMHYYVTGQDNPVVPWSKDLLGRFHERNGYSLRPRLIDLFFDVAGDTPRVRQDFYETLSDLYQDAYYRQIREWCAERNLIFTGHLLYEEWLRRQIRVEGNIFRHLRHLDVIGVDHLYPIIGTREAPDEHVAMKVGSSAAHQFGSSRLLCESFGGIFMDTTMQRMKWIADWEYVLGVNLLNPHGFHYTLEGPRKRDWPPSMFYQYPWWQQYQGFQDYIARLSSMLTGGRHVAQLAVIWPINAMFGTYTPQARNELHDRVEHGFNTLTDLLLRLHHDYDYLDEDVLRNDATVEGGAVVLGDERYELVVVPPLPFLKASTLDRLEELLAQGGRVLGMVQAPDRAFGGDGMLDVTERVERLFGVAPGEPAQETEIVMRDHPGGGRSAFVRGPKVDEAVGKAVRALIDPDVTLDNPEVMYLHRVKDARDLYFLINSTQDEQRARMSVTGAVRPLLWDPSTGSETPIVPWSVEDGRTRFEVVLPPVGSAFVLAQAPGGFRVAGVDGVAVDALSDGGRLEGRALRAGASLDVERSRGRDTVPVDAAAPEETVLDGPWELALDGPNALVLEHWQASDGTGGRLRMVPGAWAYQLPAEPPAPYPLDVEYRAEFDAEHVPGSLQVVVDGWAGESWSLQVNGRAATAAPQRAPFDSQMQTVEVGGQIQPGRNELTVRLRLTKATDGLLDLLKLLGDFAVREGQVPALVAPPATVEPASWTDQGYPFLSGRAAYRTRFDRPGGAGGRRVFLEPALVDDVVEVVVNGQSAGVRLWPPYGIEVTDLLQDGDNVLELRVANTLVNLLEAVRRPSGLSGAPRLVAYAPVTLELGS